MSSTIDIQFRAHDRDFAFKMLYDPDCAGDQYMDAELRTYGVCEPEVVHLMIRVIRPGDVVVDGGANFGFFSVIMSQLVGPEGKVLAFEPGANNWERLNANLDLNNCRNVEVVERPLWDKVEPLEFYLGADGGANSLARFPKMISSNTVQATTLGEHLHYIPRLVKLDIEGAEEHALRGGILAPYITAELNEPALARMGSSQNSLRDFMSERGYHTFALHRNDAFPTLIPPGVRIKPLILNTNLLFSTWEAVVAAWPEAVV